MKSKPVESTDTFESFGFQENIMKGIRHAGFITPSPIQKEAIPVVMAGSDVIGQAHTGTGKTAAFALPVMNRMKPKSYFELLIITPTRELAIQVGEEIFKLGQFAGIKTGAVYGGQSYDRQYKMIEQGVHAITATPGRLLDLFKSGKLKNLKPSVVVLDEADEMLDMGFLEDIQEIFKFLPEKRQTLLFSATMPEPIKRLANRILKNPVMVSTIHDDDKATNKDIQQLYCVVEENEREDAVIRIMDYQQPEKAIVFCRMKNEVEKLAQSLSARGINCAALHGDIQQSQRNHVMQGFRKGNYEVLVATDVAARGLDVADVTHVFNYHMPFDSKSYVHRIGRTGRAGKKGKAITLVTPREFYQIERIQRNLGVRLEIQMVPTLHQMKAVRTQQLMEKVKLQTLEPTAVTMVNNMGDEMDIAAIAYKLASLLLVQESGDFTGPDSIGVVGKKLEQLTSPKKRFEGKRDRFHRGGRGEERGGFRKRKFYDKRKRN